MKSDELTKLVAVSLKYELSKDKVIEKRAEVLGVMKTKIFVVEKIILPDREIGPSSYAADIWIPKHIEVDQIGALHRGDEFICHEKDEMACKQKILAIMKSRAESSMKSMEKKYVAIMAYELRN